MQTRTPENETLWTNFNMTYVCCLFEKCLFFLQEAKIAFLLSFFKLLGPGYPCTGGLDGFSIYKASCGRSLWFAVDMHRGCARISTFLTNWNLLLLNHTGLNPHGTKRHKTLTVYPVWDYGSLTLRWKIIYRNIIEFNLARSPGTRSRHTPIWNVSTESRKFISAHLKF